VGCADLLLVTVLVLAVDAMCWVVLIAAAMTVWQWVA
jgi:hypothetical protein